MIHPDKRSIVVDGTINKRDLDTIERLQAELQSARAELAAAKEALTKLRLVVQHDRARYDGDGDPGCYKGCNACIVDAALAGTGEEMARELLELRAEKLKGSMSADEFIKGLQTATDNFEAVKLKERERCAQIAIEFEPYPCCDYGAKIAAKIRSGEGKEGDE